MRARDFRGIERAVAVRLRSPVVAAAVVAATLVAATIAVALLESPPISVRNASSVYLVAVVVSAILGPLWAVVAAVGSFATYDLLFVEPRLTLAVTDPDEWLNLLLFLVVGLAVGRLAAGQTRRAAEAERRLREATASFAVSRTLATSESSSAALPAILELLRAEVEATGIRVTRGASDALIASAGDHPRPAGPIVHRLARKPGATPAEWVRTHQSGRSPHDDRGSATYRVAIEADGEDLGALWLSRRPDAGSPGREQTRLLSLAADQLGLAWQRERLADEARDADVLRRSEAAQRALLETVSHDLRTPLASIRASAGGLADPAVALSDAERRTAAQRIDAEAERLNALVGNLLDLSRIEGGSLVPRLEPHDLADLLEPALRRLAEVLPPDRIELAIPPGLEPVLVDPVLFDQALTNILQNAVRHAPGAPITIGATADEAGHRIDLRIEDGGPGVPASVLGRLFERFYRVPGRVEASRRGLGIGLAVVRGAVEAMGGTVRAELAEGGGLAVVLGLPAAPAPDATE